MMKRRIRAELLYFFAALQVLTRLPVRPLRNFSERWLERGVKYFPLAGALVGGLSAAVLWAASMIWSQPLTALLAVAAGMAITGALHEDGFADFFDSLGGATQEARLAIMKDSRIGTYGVLALGAGIGIKVSALAALPNPIGMGALVAAHSGGRFAAAAVISVLRYAGGLSAAKIKPLGHGITPVDLAVAALFGLLPVLLLPWRFALTALLAGILAAASSALFARRMLGGYTGDVLGAVEQCYEIAFLLGCAACV